MLKEVEKLAQLLLTPSQIGDILGLNIEQVNEMQNPYKEAGRLYRRILAERARDLHEKTLRLADVGSPTAIDVANHWLNTALISIE